MRVLSNRVVNEWRGREAEAQSTSTQDERIGETKLMPYSVPGGMPYMLPKFSAMLPTPETQGDFEEMCLPAGAGVGAIREIKSAAAIIAEMMSEARARCHTQTLARV